MYQQKHKRRNTTNRNLIVIAVGFLATFMAVGFIYQSYVIQWDRASKEHSIVFKIEDSTKLLQGKKFDLFLFDSVIYSDTVSMINQQYLHTTSCRRNDQLVTIFFYDIEETASKKISLADTGTTYMKLTVAKSDSKEILLQLSEFDFKKE